MKLTVENLTQLIKEEVNNFIIESSFASQKAKEFGLIHRGFGTYSKDPDGPIVYRTTKDGKLAKVKNIGKWQKYRSEKAQQSNKKEQEAEDNEFNINPDIATKKHITNVRYIGDRQYKFMYGDSKKKITFSKQEFDLIATQHLNVSQVIYDKLKTIEHNKKMGKKNSSAGIYNDFS